MRIEMAEGILQRQGYEQYRKRLAELLAADMGIRALPALSTLPLTVLNESGQDVWLGELLDSDQPIVLRGVPGSGRRIALIQLLDHWIASGAERGSLPLPVDLAILDDGQASPFALLTALIAELGHGDSAWKLLIIGWEELAEERRTAWRTLFIHGPLPRSTQLCAVLAAGDEPNWPGMPQLLIPAPNYAEIGRWFTHLAPQVRQQVLLQAVGPNPTLLRCALAVWYYEQGMLTASRSERERMGQTLVRRYTKWQIDLPAAVSLGSERFYSQRAELHSEAQELINTGDYTPAVQHVQREDLVLLLAEIAPAGDALLKALVPACWNDPHLLILAGHVLQLRPPQAAALTLGLLRALGRLAHTATMLGEQALAVLGQCRSMLEQALHVASERHTYRLIRAVLLALPEEIARPHLATYAYAEQIPAAIGWELTDRMIDVGAIEGLEPEEQPALARWAYAHALDVDYGHEMIVAGDPTAAIRALAATPPDRKELAAAALLHNQSLPLVVRLAALSLLEGATNNLAVAEELLRDPSREVRIAAAQLLQRVAPRRAVLAYVQVARADLPRAVRGDALAALSESRGRLTVITLYECALDRSLGIALQLQALRGLANRHGGLKRLTMIAADPGQDVCLRVIALHLLGLRPIAARHRSTRSVLPMQIVLEQHPPALMAAAACRQLGKIGGTRAVQTLLRVLEDSAADPDLTKVAMTALGQTRDARAIPVLALLLGSTALLRLQQACPEELLRKPTIELLGMRELDVNGHPHTNGSVHAEAFASQAVLPVALEQGLRAAVANCLTLADRPSTPNEYLVLAADEHRRVAAAALAEIGGEQVQDVLVAALVAGECGNAAGAICAALAAAGGSADATALADVLMRPELSLRVRWAVAQELVKHPAAERQMLAAVSTTTLDDFTRGELAEGLGTCQVAAAALPLAELARDPNQDSYLRERALYGLGRLGGAAAEAVLRRIMNNVREDVQLRGLAAGQFGAALSDETREILRAYIRDRQAAPELVIGALQSLSNARDYALLPQMMELLYDVRAEVARAAIAAVTKLGDSGVTSILIALSQEVRADRSVRLNAVGALLKIADRDYSLLLRDYLNSATMPVQLQALDQLIDAGCDVAILLPFLQDQERALPFRLRVLEAIADRLTSAVPLVAMLHDPQEPPELRGRIAQILAGIGGPTAHNLLAEIALRHGDHLGTRLACLTGLTKRNNSEITGLLAQLVEATNEHPTIREHASLALVQLTAQEGGAA